MADAVCNCGHPDSDHYLYQKNGRPQMRCSKCDPFHGKRKQGIYEITVGLDDDIRDKLADHYFGEYKGRPSRNDMEKGQGDPLKRKNK